MDEQRVRSWVKRNARPLECARWEYLFEGGSKDKVIGYLTAFQNDDGGFGHGLEPDFWLPYSSAIATWSAGQILMEVGADREDRVVDEMIDYLVKSYEPELGLWKTVTPKHNDYPHAPWWHYEEGAQNFWMFNPSVELAAFLVHWGPEGSEAAMLGWKTIEKASERLLNCTEMGFHEVNNYQQFLHIVGKKIKRFEELTEKVNQLVEKSINTDSESWGKSYSPLPLNLIHKKSDPLYPKYASLVAENILYLERSVQDDGVWNIKWDWEQDLDHFAVAKQQWRGILAVNHTKLIKEFGV